MPRVVHFEIGANDPEKLIEFYKTIFGWKIEKWEGPIDYWMVMTGEETDAGIDGGLMKRQDENTNTVNTIDVPNLDEYMKMVEESGGTIVQPKQAVPGVGWMCYFKDPQGNTFGMMQEDKSAK
jgi:predicted enzyme related to lactoylglutathione lyase